MKIILQIVLISSIIFLGCATFKSDMDGKFNHTTEKNFGADRVNVLFIFSHYRQTIGYDAIPKLDNKYQRINGFDDFFRDALNELTNIDNYATYTEYASDVNEPERRALKDSLMRSNDYVVDMKFKREKSFAKYFLGSIGSAITLTLVPIPYHNSYAVEVEIYNSERQLIKTCSRNSGLTKWVQALLIFAYPFHPEKRKQEELYVDYLHDIFRQIEAEKVLAAKRD